MMLTLLFAAVLFFVAHLILIFTSFGKRGYHPYKYFWSHGTLWLAGILVSILLFNYSGKGVSSMADVFDTPFKKILPVLVAFALSLIAHAVVKFLVLPGYSSGSRQH